MKGKKLIAISLCVGIAASGIGVPLTGYAKDEEEQPSYEYDNSLDHSMVSELPPQNLIELEPVIYPQEGMPNDKILDAPAEEVLYQGTQSTVDPEGEDLYHIGSEEVEDMLQKGYTVEDIFEADRIGNETGIEPEMLLEKKAVSGQSLEQIKDDILEENMEKTSAMLKEKYKSGYEKLKKTDLEEAEITLLLAYADINQAEVSDKLIKEYQKTGDKLFEKSKEELSQSGLSKATKEKYGISDSEAEELSEELLDKLEVLSQKTGKPVEELIEGYLQAAD